jgi:hypothetical protein
MGHQVWQQGLSFNFVNMHLKLFPGVSSALIQANTPIFSLYPIVARNTYQLTDARSLK